MFFSYWCIPVDSQPHPPHFHGYIPRLGIAIILGTADLQETSTRENQKHSELKIYSVVDQMNVKIVLGCLRMGLTLLGNKLKLF